MKEKIVHHLVHIHELKHLGSIFYMGCGYKYKLNEKGIKNCSHIAYVTCKRCLKKFKLNQRKKRITALV